MVAKNVRETRDVPLKDPKNPNVVSDKTPLPWSDGTPRNSRQTRSVDVPSGKSATRTKNPPGTPMAWPEGKHPADSGGRTM